MRQALHIFRKDARGLWIYIAQVLVMTALFAIAGSLRAARPLDPKLSDFDNAFGFAMLLVWAILAGALIQAEPLVGDRQYWLTRPYSWRSLLAAKLIFLATFILLPKLIADMVILSAHGFAPLPLLPGLLSRLAALALFDLLPVTLIAALSPNFLSFALATGSAAGVLFSLTFVLTGLQWSDALAPRIWTAQYAGMATLALAGLVLLTWQFARRCTLRTLACALAAIVVVPVLAHHAFSWTSQFALQTRLATLHPAPGSIKASFDPAGVWRNSVIGGSNGDRTIELGLDITGEPAGTVPVLEGARFTLQTPSGSFAPGGQEPWMNVDNRPRIEAPDPTIQFVLNASRWRACAYQPLTIRGTAYVAVYGNRRHVQIAEFGRPFNLNGVAHCGLYDPHQRLQGPVLLCQAALGFRPGRLKANTRRWWPSSNQREPDNTERLGDAPLILSTAFDPLRFSDEIDPISVLRSYRSTGDDDQPLVEFEEPLGYFTVDFELPGVILASYVPRSPTYAYAIVGTIQGRVSYDGPARPSDITVALVDPMAFQLKGLPGFVRRASRFREGTYSISVPQLGTYYVVAAPIGTILQLSDGIADEQTRDQLMRYARKITLGKFGEKLSVDLTAQTR